MVRRIIGWKYWAEVVRLLTFTVVTFLLIFALVAHSHQQATQHNLLATVKQNTATIKAQQDTIISLSKQLKAETDSIHDQASCIFLFFSQPQTDRNNTSVTYPPACVVTSNPSSPGGATESTKSGAVIVSQTPQSSPSSPKVVVAPPKTPQPQPKPQPVKSLTCKLTLGLLGCG